MEKKSRLGRFDTAPIQIEVDVSDTPCADGEFCAGRRSGDFRRGRWACVAAAIVSLLMLTVIIGLLYRLLRACLIVDGTELISRGYFRDRHFPKSQIVGAAVAPTWYTWRRLVVPATLFLMLDGGKRVRISGVQCHIGNIGVSRAPIEEEIQRSYPQEVADYLNTNLLKPVDLSG